MYHSEQKYAHFCSEWCIVGYGRGALWDLWDKTDLTSCQPNPVEQTSVKKSLHLSFKKYMQHINMLSNKILLLFFPQCVIKTWRGNPASVILPTCGRGWLRSAGCHDSVWWVVQCDGAVDSGRTCGWYEGPVHLLDSSRGLGQSNLQQYFCLYRSYSGSAKRI